MTFTRNGYLSQVVNHARMQFQWDDDADLQAFILWAGLWFLTLKPEEKRDEKVVRLDNHRTRATANK